MSEYQYYEFQAIDRPLTAADQAALRSISTRARITSTSFTNHYEWGDLKADPRELMEQWFDLHLYLANWATRRLMMRLPERLVDQSSLDVFLFPVDWVEVWVRGDNLIIDMCREEVEAGYEGWDDGSGWLAALAPLRTDVLAGDMRLFYLLWLTAVEDGALKGNALEPLPGLGPITGPLEGAAEFFGIDPDLVRAAAERGPESMDAALSADATRAVLAEIPEREKTDLLARIVDGDPHVAAELKRRVRRKQGHEPAEPRTVRHLRARAAAIRRERNRVEAERREAERRRLAEEQEAARRKRLDALIAKGDSVWRTIEDEIGRRNAPAYDRAAGLLFDLQAISAEQGTLADFARRVETLREKHARKEKFIERLKGLKTR